MNPDFLVMLMDMTTAMRISMMDDLTDADLAVRISGNPSLGELCREMGNTERDYLNSYKTGTHIEGSQRDDSPEMAASVEKLKAWYQALDDEFKATLKAIPDSEFEGKTIDRSGHTMPATMHYHTYHEALLIFYAKCSVYLRMMGKPLSEQMVGWIG
jgi:hypothetical protein